MRYVFWFGTLLLAVACSIFAISNQALVDVTLWPFSGRLELPLYALALGTAAVGLLVGLFGGWLRALPVRMARRRLAQRLSQVEDELRRLKNPTPNPVVSALPSLPAKVDS